MPRVCGGTVQYTKRSVAVNECDEQEEWTEGDGTGEQGLHEESRPAAQEEDMYEQPGGETQTWSKASQQSITRF